MDAHTPSESRVEIFTGPNCGYCRRAKAVFEKRNLQYREIDVSAEGGRSEMAHRLPRARSIPQIFIDGAHVGGCEDLERLDANGALAAMVGGAGGRHSDRDALQAPS